MDLQVVADLIPAGKTVRYSIVKLRNEPLWTRQGDVSWEEFAKAFQFERIRASQGLAQASRGTDDDLARIERATRFALCEILDDHGTVLRTQLVTPLLAYIVEHGMPDRIAHALKRRRDLVSAATPRARLTARNTRLRLRCCCRTAPLSSKMSFARPTPLKARGIRVRKSARRP